LILTIGRTVQHIMLLSVIMVTVVKSLKPNGYFI